MTYFSYIGEEVLTTKHLNIITRWHSIINNFYICVTAILNFNPVNHHDSLLEFNSIAIFIHSEIQLQESWLVVLPERDETKNEKFWKTIYVCQSVINDLYWKLFIWKDKNFFVKVNVNILIEFSMSMIWIYLKDKETPLNKL